MECNKGIKYQHPTQVDRIIILDITFKDPDNLAEYLGTIRLGRADKGYTERNLNIHLVEHLEIEQADVKVLHILLKQGVEGIHVPKEIHSYIHRILGMPKYMVSSKKLTIKDFTLRTSTHPALY